MGDSKGTVASDHLFVGGNHGRYDTVAVAVIAILVPMLLSTLFLGKKREKQRGVPVDVGGEAGYAVRNAKVPNLIEVPWRGATTMTALFKHLVRNIPQNDSWD